MDLRELKALEIAARFNITFDGEAWSVPSQTGGGRYRVYFAARFNRPFSTYGTWQQGTLIPGGTSASDTQPVTTNRSDTAKAGAYATFDTRHDRGVQVKIGISFVSVDGARRNLDAEQHGFNFGKVLGGELPTAVKQDILWNNAARLLPEWAGVTPGGAS